LLNVRDDRAQRELNIKKEIVPMNQLMNCLVGLGVAAVAVLTTQEAKAGCGSWENVESTTANATVSGTDLCCDPSSCGSGAHVAAASYGVSFGGNGERSEAYETVYGYNAVNGTNSGLFAEVWGNCGGTWVESSMVGPFNTVNEQVVATVSCGGGMSAAIAWVWLD
jgi:hypothetical protein